MNSRVFKALPSKTVTDGDEDTCKHLCRHRRVLTRVVADLMLGGGCTPAQAAGSEHGAGREAANPYKFNRHTSSGDFRDQTGV